MNDLTIFPAHLNALSVGQLAGLAHSQLHEVNTNLDQLIDWAKKARLKVDAALEQRTTANGHARISPNPAAISAPPMSSTVRCASPSTCPNACHGIKSNWALGLPITHKYFNLYPAA